MKELRKDFIDVLKEMITGLVKQGKPAMLPDGSCVYRTECGNKCAIGQIITDEEYSKELENQVITDSKVKIAVQRSIGFDLDCEEIEILSRIQKAHDNLKNLEKPLFIVLIENLTDYSRGRNLSYWGGDIVVELIEKIGRKLEDEQRIEKGLSACNHSA